MTHRLERGEASDLVSLEFHGQLDAAALESLRAAIALARARGAQVRVILRAGTEVERALLPALRELEVTLEVESPYLARWLAREP